VSNKILKRIESKNINELSSKQDEINFFKNFYNSCFEGSYLRMILDNAGVTPNAVQKAIESDFSSI